MWGMSNYWISNVLCGPAIQQKIIYLFPLCAVTSWRCICVYDFRKSWPTYLLYSRIERYLKITITFSFLSDPIRTSIHIKDSRKLRRGYSWFSCSNRAHELLTRTGIALGWHLCIIILLRWMSWSRYIGSTICTTGTQCFLCYCFFHRSWYW